MSFSAIVIGMDGSWKSIDKFNFVLKSLLEMQIRNFLCSFCNSLESTEVLSFSVKETKLSPLHSLLHQIYSTQHYNIIRDAVVIIGHTVRKGSFVLSTDVG